MAAKPPPLWAHWQVDEEVLCLSAGHAGQEAAGGGDKASKAAGSKADKADKADKEVLMYPAKVLKSLSGGKGAKDKRRYYVHYKVRAACSYAIAMVPHTYSRTIEIGQCSACVVSTSTVNCSQLDLVPTVDLLSWS